MTPSPPTLRFIILRLWYCRHKIIDSLPPKALSSFIGDHWLLNLALNYFVLVTLAVDAMVPPQGAANNKDEEKNSKPFHHSYSKIRRNSKFLKSRVLISRIYVTFVTFVIPSIFCIPCWVVFSLWTFRKKCYIKFIIITSYNFGILKVYIVDTIEL